MKQTENNTYDVIYSHNAVNDVHRSLLINQVISNLKADNPFIEIDSTDLKKVCWLISILANSDNDKYRQKADDIAKLLFLQNLQNGAIATFCDIILRRTGNLPAIKHLDQLSFVEKKLDVVVTQEALVNKYSGMVRINNEPIFLSTFQLHLWSALNKSSDVLISGPTSAGKSYIVQSYILDKLLDSETYIAVYVVPSRALINQVVEDFRRRLKNNKTVELRTSFEERNINSNQDTTKYIYIVTPERCIKLLEKGYNDTINPNFIFIDEIQNIDRDDERALLYDLLISETKLYWTNVQLVLAGPYITNLKTLYKEILPESEVSDISSIFSPVVHNYTTVIPDRALSQYELNVWTDSGAIKLVKSIPTDIRSELSKTKGAIIARVVTDIANEGPNLIYCAQSNYATDWALAGSKVELTPDKSFNQSKQVTDFIAFLKTEFHKDYHLATCLSKGIAYHHSRLPDIVRLEIEDLFSNKFIKHLYCTSTLLEGVNLPANNIFITSAKKKDKELTAFEFGNLKGRAGRISKGLQGSVYCIEVATKGEEGWSNKYMNANSEQAISSRYSSSKFPSFIDISKELDKGIINIEEAPLARFILHLRNKYYRNPEEFKKYLSIGYHDDIQLESIFNKIRESLSSLIVPKSIVLKNPTIDPILQNTLYETIISEGTFNWVIHETENLFSRWPRQIAENYPLHERPLFYQLEFILKKLDIIFKINSESWKNNNTSTSISQMALHTARWIKGDSYRVMIQDDLNHYSSNRCFPEERIDPSNPDHVNFIIGKLIKINSQVVTFVVVKYLKLLVTMLEDILDEDGQLKYSYTLKFPAKIELGTSNSFALELIINGIPRSIAVELVKFIPKKYDGSALEWLSKQNREKLRIHQIYKKHLIKLGYL